MFSFTNLSIQTRVLNLIYMIQIHNMTYYKYILSNNPAKEHFPSNGF